MAGSWAASPVPPLRCCGLLRGSLPAGLVSEVFRRRVAVSLAQVAAGPLPLAGVELLCFTPPLTRPASARREVRVCSAAGEAPALAGCRPHHFEFWGRFLCKVLHAELGPGRVIRGGCFALLKAQLAAFNSV